VEFGGRSQDGVAETVRIGGLLYAVTVSGIRSLYIEGEKRVASRIESSLELVREIHELRDELRDTLAIARGAVPHLERFSSEWGRRLIPDDVLAAPPDVLVIVPHASLHDVPLHLVALDGGDLLGFATGVSYASSRSLLARCAARNPARGNIPPTHELDNEQEARNFVGGGTDVIRRDPRFKEIPKRLADRLGVTETASYDSLERFSFKWAGSPELACVVAHGFIDREKHRLSGLLVDKWEGIILMRPIPLYGEPITFRDLPLRDVPPSVHTSAPTEVLTAAELEIDAAVSARLVLLLGCSAGSGRVLQADEPASLAETFLHIGAVSVIAPAWASDVEATTRWVDAFADSWIGTGRATALAVRDATRQLLNDGYGLERSGALTLRGDWL
jgi:hypothetical protein